MTINEAQALVDKDWSPAREAETDEHLGTLKWDLNECVSLTVNPRYIKAPFEECFLTRDGVIKPAWPYRFETQEDCQKFYLSGDARTSAVPFFLATKPDGTSYESW